MHVSIDVRSLCLLFCIAEIRTHPNTELADTDILHYDHGSRRTEEKMNISLIHGLSVTEKEVSPDDDLEDLPTEGDVTDDPWKLVTDSPPVDPRFWPTVGNGHVATVVYSDTVFMNGLYNGNGTESMRARIPAYTSVDIQSISQRQNSRMFTLDMKKGIFLQEYKGDNWTVQLETYAHRTNTRLLVTMVTIVTKSQLLSDLTVELSVNHGDLQSVDLDLTNETSNITDARYTYGQAKIPETPTSERVPVHIFYSTVPDQIIVPGNTPAHTYKHLYLAAISPFPDEARDSFLQGIQSFREDELTRDHVRGWNDVWDSGCIDVEGNTTLASSVYSALYYILSAMPTVEELTWPFIGLSPEDLAHGNIPDIQYGGHIFWDQETWMYPTILALHSNLGKTLVGTRIRTLDSAYLYASQRGYKGAMYPWESAFVGLNVSPGGRWAKYEMHISGDIAFAFQQYLMMTGDTDILAKGRLAEAIVGIAEFWKSRSTFNESRGTYDILDVMPPDEWNYPVNNSAYTNAVAKISLLLPKYAYGLMGETAPKIYEEVADLMYMPVDKERNFHPEFDGFTLNDTVKQADVVLLGYPLMVDMTEEERKNDLDIYEKLTPGGPAMTWSMFTIGWLELGDTEKASEVFYRQLENKRQPFNVWTEEASGGGATNFITGMGGYLQSVLFGYGGLRMHSDRVDFNCTLIPDTTGFTVRGLDYLGSCLDIQCTDEHVAVTLTKQGLVKLNIFLYKSSKSELLSLGHVLKLPRQKFAVKSSSATHGSNISTLMMGFAVFFTKTLVSILRSF